MSTQPRQTAPPTQHALIAVRRSMCTRPTYSGTVLAVDLAPAPKPSTWALVEPHSRPHATAGPADEEPAAFSNARAHFLSETRGP
ncbi:MAG TPA: hypothetical protein VES02_15165 [Dermatophilaceae bacterium]|nr:hypothetical protein [Dermatophilaceae bacterium]